MECHCNIEISSSVHIIKYLYKYLQKRPDRTKVALVNEGNVDEIKDFVTARYVSASEALWRIFEYDICGQYPTVTPLPVHFPKQDTIVFREGKEKEALENAASKLPLYLNRPKCPELDNLTYLDFFRTVYHQHIQTEKRV